MSPAKYYPVGLKSGVSYRNLALCAGFDGRPSRKPLLRPAIPLGPRILDIYPGRLVCESGVVQLLNHSQTLGVPRNSRGSPLREPGWLPLAHSGQLINREVVSHSTPYKLVLGRSIRLADLGLAEIAA